MLHPQTTKLLYIKEVRYQSPETVIENQPISIESIHDAKGWEIPVYDRRCEICGRIAGSLFKVNHKDRGQVKICSDCWQRERCSLIRSGGCCCS